MVLPFARMTVPPGAGVAVVGLGAMGGPVAGHLSAAGLRPMLVDLDPDIATRYARGGGTAVSLGDVGDAQVVLVAVPSDDDVRAVCLEGGLAASLGPGSVLCIASSVRPETCAAIAAAASAADVLDTALTGGVRAAEAGTVNLLVGGSAEALDRARWALEPWTATIHHMGGLGAGQIAKTCNNMLHWAQICAIHESLELGRRYGLSVPALRSALLDSPVASRTLAELDQMRLTWHAKDLANALLMGEVVGQDLPMAALSQALMPTISTARLADLLAADGGGVVALIGADDHGASQTIASDRTVTRP